MQDEPAFHGGKSFEAIGEDFLHLERSERVITADVLDSWFDPSPRVLRKIAQFLPLLLKSSPPVNAHGLVEAIARARGVPPECVLTGGGSSELMFACLPRLLERGWQALFFDPTYGEYRHLFEEIGAQLVRFELREDEDFRVDTERLIAEVRRVRPALVTVVNPNSPTGQLWPRAELVSFLDAVPEETLVVVDETYIDYVGMAESVEREACRRSNVLVLKSMSKAYALSGARVGYLVASRELTGKLARWIPPWSVGLLAQVAGVEALADVDYYAGCYRETHALREQLQDELSAIEGVHVFPSRTNFILLRVPVSAQGILTQMRRSDIFVRNCDSMGVRFHDRFLRIAVRRGDENARIVQAFREALNPVGKDVNFGDEGSRG